VSITAFLPRIAQILDGSGLPHILTGSLAAAYCATPRATQHIDVVIDTEEEGIDRLVQRFLDAGFCVDREAALAAWRTHGQVNAIDPDSGWNADLIVRKGRSFSRTEFARRERINPLGIEVSLASLEDVVTAELEWAQMGESEPRRTGVVRLREPSTDRLDRAYLETWVAELGLAEASTTHGQLRRLQWCATSETSERDPRSRSGSMVRAYPGSEDR